MILNEDTLTKIAKRIEAVLRGDEGRNGDNTEVVSTMDAPSLLVEIMRVRQALGEATGVLPFSAEFLAQAQRVQDALSARIGIDAEGNPLGGSDS